jgi:hypothetical protein
MLAIMSRLRLLVALIGVSVLAALLALAAFSTEADASHSWGNYHWANNKDSDGNGVPDPFVLKLGDNVSQAISTDPTSNWDIYLDTASSNDANRGWDYSSVLDTNIVRPGGVAPKSCKPLNGRVDVCNAKYGTNGWLGLAGISVSGRHITKAYVKLNDTYFNRAQYNTPAWRNLVMCQEIGHTFGLDHTDEIHNNANLGSCMDYTNDPDGGAGGASATDPSNEYPGGDDPTTTDTVETDHDYAHLNTIYAHLDATTTISPSSAASPMAPAAIQGDDNTQRGWGRKIRDSGKLELWELDLGGGNKLFRFVIRA